MKETFECSDKYQNKISQCSCNKCEEIGNSFEIIGIEIFLCKKHQNKIDELCNGKSKGVFIGNPKEYFDDNWTTIGGTNLK